MRRKLTSILSAVLLAMTLMPMTAWAEIAETVDAVFAVEAAEIAAVEAVEVAEIEEVAEITTKEGNLENSETDSAGKLLSEGTNVAKIGDQGYETLDGAILAAKTGDVIEILQDCEYKMPEEISKITTNITIKAVDDVNAVFDCTGSGNVCAIPNGVTIENVTMNFGTNTYHGVQHAGTIDMVKCTLNGLFYSYSDMNFKECIFNAPGTEYSMWCYAGNITYTDCIFNGAGKFLNVYNEGNGAWEITATGCTFNNSGEKKKAPFNVKDWCNNGNQLHYTISVSNCTVDDPSKFPAEGVTWDNSDGTTGLALSPLVQVDDFKVDGPYHGIVIILDGVKVYENGAKVAPPVANIGETGYSSLEAAIEAAAAMTGTKEEPVVIELSEGAVQNGDMVFASLSLSHVVIKGAPDHKSILKDCAITFQGSACSFEDVTFDGITFDNSCFVMSSNWDTIKGLSFTDNVYQNLTGSYAPVHLSSNTAEDFTFTENTITNVTGANVSGLKLTDVMGTCTVSGNRFEGIAYNGIQISGNISGTLQMEDNTIISAGSRALRLGSIAEGTVVNMTGNTAVNAVDEAGEAVKATSCASKDKATYQVSGNVWNGTVYNPELYNCVRVTFDTQGGTPVPAAQTVVEGQTAEEPDPAPEKEGYTFAGWYNGEAEYKFTVPVTEDLTLTAKWEQGKKAPAEIKTFRFTFNYCTGERVSQEVKEGETVQKIADPVREGYQFAGWYADENLSAEYDFTAPVTADTTVYAKWANMKKESDLNLSGNVSELEITVAPKNEKEESAVKEIKENKARQSAETIGTLIDAIKIDKLPLKEDTTDIRVTVDMNLESVESDEETGQIANLIYKVEPYVVELDKSGTVIGEKQKLENRYLNNRNISVKLPIPSSVKESYAVINHISSDGSSYIIKPYPEIVNAGTKNAYVEIKIRHFSEFEITFTNSQYVAPTYVSSSGSSGKSAPLFTGTWNNPVKNGSWSQDAQSIWHYTTLQQFRNTWGYIFNPYAKEGQHTSDWFWFDAKGNMLTGWQLINGKWYYLNPSSDGTLGACLLGPGKTPDGYEIDANGAWTGK